MTLKVLVTGATGFIGRHAVKRLVADGWTVYGVSLEDAIIAGVRIDPLDLTDVSQFAVWSHDKTFDAILHLAAAIPPQISGPIAENSFNVNIAAMMNVLRLACERRCHVIYSSTSTVYGVAPRIDIPLFEESPPKPDNYYCTSKYVGELLCAQLAQADALSYTTLRLSAPYGPGNTRPTVINIFLKHALASEDLRLFGSGSRTQDFTYIDDVIEGLCLALTTRINGTFNIASGKPVSMRELAALAIETVRGSHSAIVNAEKADPQENYRAVFAIQRARDVLGWSPKVSLRQGMKYTLEAMRQEGSVI